MTNPCFCTYNRVGMDLTLHRFVIHLPLSVLRIVPRIWWVFFCCSVTTYQLLRTHALSFKCVSAVWEVTTSPHCSLVCKLHLQRRHNVACGVLISHRLFKYCCRLFLDYLTTHFDYKLDHLAPNGRISGWLIRKDVGRSGRGLFKAVSRPFPGGTLEHLETRCLSRHGNKRHVRQWSDHVKVLFHVTAADFCKYSASNRNSEFVLGWFYKTSACSEHCSVRSRTYVPVNICIQCLHISWYCSRRATQIHTYPNVIKRLSLSEWSA
jgi:hypothetical protein